MDYKLKHDIPIGGLVALAINDDESLLFTVTHSGRGVFDLNSGERLARDYDVIYPDDNNFIEAIDPYGEDKIQIEPYDFENDLIIISKSGKYRIIGESSGIQIEENTEPTD